MLKVVTLMVLLVCTVLGARSCNSSSSGSDLNPSKVVGNGLAGLCANQNAVDSAGDQPTAGTVLSPSAEGQLNSALGLVGQRGTAGALSCPAPTTAP
jgi:hypothetical protein